MKCICILLNHQVILIVTYRPYRTESTAKPESILIISPYPNTKETNKGKTSQVDAITRGFTKPAPQAPCLAFSAQIKAMIRLNSALCANCSCFVCSSTSSLAAMSLLTLSMRFCSVNSFDSVLSRNGALKVMFVGDAPELGMRISSLRGGFRAAGLLAAPLVAGGGDWGLWEGSCHVSLWLRLRGR